MTKKPAKASSQVDCLHLGLLLENLSVTLSGPHIHLGLFQVSFTSSELG